MDAENKQLYKLAHQKTFASLLKLINALSKLTPTVMLVHNLEQAKLEVLESIQYNFYWLFAAVFCLPEGLEASVHPPLASTSASAKPSLLMTYIVKRVLTVNTALKFDVASASLQADKLSSQAILQKKGSPQIQASLPSTQAHKLQKYHKDGS